MKKFPLSNIQLTKIKIQCLCSVDKMTCFISIETLDLLNDPLLNLLAYAVPNNAEHHDGTGRYFWKVTELLSQSAASTRCKDEGGDLATVDTEKLLEFVKSRFT